MYCVDRVLHIIILGFTIKSNLSFYITIQEGSVIYEINRFRNHALLFGCYHRSFLFI